MFAVLFLIDIVMAEELVACQPDDPHLSFGISNTGYTVTSDSIISEYNVMSLEVCFMHCYTTDRCTTVAFRTMQYSNGTSQCILSSSVTWIADFVAVPSASFNMYTDELRCRVNPCYNGGICHEQPSTPTCVCPQYVWMGERCDMLHPCTNCVVKSTRTCMGNDTSGYTCMCKDGYGGEFCQEDYFRCMRDPCEQFEECTNATNATDTSYECSCPDGFGGVMCATDLLRCARNPVCGATNVCVNTTNGYNCVCDPVLFPPGCTGECKKTLGRGTGGNPFSHAGQSSQFISSIDVGLSTYANSLGLPNHITITYGGQTVTTGKTDLTITGNVCILESGEYIVEVEATDGLFKSTYPVIGSLKFTTNLGKVCGPWGILGSSYSTASGGKLRYISGGIGSAFDYMTFYFECDVV